MRKTMVDVPTADGTADAYLLSPDGDGPYPGVVLFMDAFGLRDRIEEMAGRIAERGYTVLAPNIFYRFGRTPLIDLTGLDDAEQRGRIFQQAMPMIQSLNADTMRRDGQAYLDFLDAQAGVATGPDAIVGYCMGGRNALLVATAHPDRITALAVFHAASIATDSPASPHLGVGALRGEAYFAHADNDQSNGPEAIKALETALQEASVESTSEVYAGAPHGFTMADTPMYHAEAEQRHWDNLFALLERALPVPAV